MLALSAPYGFAEGFHISLIAEDGFDARRAEEIIVRFGCPKRVAEKAISCLQYSNRYDCVVSPTWFAYEQSDLRHQLGKTGVEMQVRSRPDPGYIGRAAQKVRQGLRFTKEPYKHFQAQNLRRDEITVPSARYDHKEAERIERLINEEHNRIFESAQRYVNGNAGLHPLDTTRRHR